MQGKRYAVFAIRKLDNGSSVWVRAGSAFLNKDDSMNVYLDVLPLDGKLHVREPGERKDAAGSTASANGLNVVTLESMGGH